MIPLEDCKLGTVYELRSRNLVAGAFDGKHGFVGVREKFNNLYLFTEHHWSQEYFPTARPIRELCQLPDSIVPSDSLGSICTNCSNQQIFWVKYAQPIDLGMTERTLLNGGKEPYQRLGRGQWVCVGGCSDPRAARLGNPPLFDFLRPYDESINMDRYIEEWTSLMSSPHVKEPGHINEIERWEGAMDKNCPGWRKRDLAHTPRTQEPTS